MSADEIRSLEDQRFAAMVAGDVASLEKLLSDDLIYTHSSASLDTKASLIDAIKTKKFTYQGFKRSDEKIRVFGDAAVVNGRAEIDLGSRILNARYTDVWARKAGGWQMVSWQSTSIPAPA